jgi:hypothetical protein
MSEQPTSESFIVRVYRVSTGDHRSIIGLVEALDGSEERERFGDIDELGIILNRRAGGRKKRGAKSERRFQVAGVSKPGIPTPEH